jgi:hypothetical protein
MATAPTTALMSIVRAEVEPAGFRQIACYDFTKADHEDYFLIFETR